MPKSLGKQRNGSKIEHRKFKNNVVIDEESLALTNHQSYNNNNSHQHQKIFNFDTKSLN